MSYPPYAKAALGGTIEFDGVADFRVYNKDGYGAGLNMTRSLGDLSAHRECGLIADPEVGEYMAAKLQDSTLSALQRASEPIIWSCIGLCSLCCR